MAFAETTLSAAVAVGDKSIVVASATSVAAGRFVRVDDEIMEVTKEYVSGTTVPVLRAREGTAQVAHVASARVIHGLATDFSSPGPGSDISFPPAGRVRQVVSVSATSTLTLPPAGTDLVVVINTTGAVTLTVPVPTKDMDGTILYFVNSGAAAHVPTFTGGLGGAGTSYDALTFNATGRIAFSVIACDEVWCAFTGPAWTGTVTNITAGIA
jgi:hypothetical protein